MTDGPYKNLKLGRFWRKFGRVVQNPTFGLTQCVENASYALRKTLATPENIQVVQTLRAASASQLPLDPVATLDLLFESAPKSAFLDTLRKHIRFLVGDGCFLDDAIQPGLSGAVEEMVDETKSRIEEEFLCARDVGRIHDGECDNALRMIAASFDAVDRSAIVEAIISEKSDSINVRKQDGLEEGPYL